MRDERGLLTLVQGAIIAALLGVLVGNLLPIPEPKPAGLKAAPSQYQRTWAAIMRAHAFSGP